MIVLKYLFLALSFFFLYLAYKQYMLYKQNKKLTKLWQKIKKAYKKDDFTTINATIPKIKKIEDDPLLKLLEVEKFMYGKNVFQDRKKAMDLLMELNSIQIPKKNNFEKSKLTKNIAKSFAPTIKKEKQIKYLKKIKQTAMQIWNQNDFDELKIRFNIFKD